MAFCDIRDFITLLKPLQPHWWLGLHTCIQWQPTVTVTATCLKVVAASEPCVATMLCLVHWVQHLCTHTYLTQVQGPDFHCFAFYTPGGPLSGHWKDQPHGAQCIGPGCWPALTRGSDALSLVHPMAQAAYSKQWWFQKSHASGLFFKNWATYYWDGPRVWIANDVTTIFPTCDCLCQGSLLKR
jgi:hypothetical protein